MFLNEFIIKKACELYSDIDMPVRACIEQYLTDNMLMDNDNAFELSMELMDYYINNFRRF